MEHENKEPTPNPWLERLALTVVVMLSVLGLGATLWNFLSREYARLTTPACDPPAEWQIVYEHDRDLYLWDGTDTRKLIDEKWDIHYAVWSPETGQLAYEGNQDETWHLAVADGTDRQVIFRSDEHGGSFSWGHDYFGPGFQWSPNGAYLGFVVDAEPAILYTAEVASGTLNRIAEDVRSVWGWAPGGVDVVFKSDLDIYRAPRDGSAAPTRFLEYSRFVPLWSPDGRYLAHGEHGEASDLTYVSEAATMERFYTLLGQPHAWSADSRFLFHHRDSYLDMETGEVGQLADGARFWDQRGAEVLYSVGRRLYIRELPDGTPRLLYQADRDFAMHAGYPWPQWRLWSPDGTHVYVKLRADAEGVGYRLYLISVADGDVQDLGEGDGAFSPMWSPDGRYLVYEGPHGFTYLHDMAERCRLEHDLALGTWRPAPE